MTGYDTGGTPLTNQAVVGNVAVALSDILLRFKKLEGFLISDLSHLKNEKESCQIFQEMDFVSQSINELQQFLTDLSRRYEDNALSHCARDLVDRVKLESVREVLKTGQITSQSIPVSEKSEKICLFE